MVEQPPKVPHWVPWAAGVIFAAGVTVTNVMTTAAAISELRSEQRELREEATKARERMATVDAKIDVLLARAAIK